MNIPANIKSCARKFIRNKWFRVGVVLLAYLALMQFARYIPWPWYISINETNSLPYKVFFVVRNRQPELGDYIDFWPPENQYYSGISFIKQIVAVPQDIVTCRNREILIDNNVSAIAKTHSLDGRQLHLGPCGQIPKRHYYVLATHRDSFDSRYREIGYVPFEAVRGVAFPLF